MSEETLDLNIEEEDTSSGGGQPEIDASTVSPDDSQESEDGTITLSKDDYQKLVEDKENYKKGLLSLKEKSKTTKEKSEVSESEFLPKKDFYKANEKEATQKFLVENPEMKAEWGEFVKHYTGRRGRDTVNAIVQDLDDAKTLFQKYHETRDVNDKETEANLASEASQPATAGGVVKPEKGSFLKVPTPVDKWYATED